MQGPSEAASGRARRAFPMHRILLVKTTSLGDVIHCLPAASDVAAHYPGVEIDWVVEDTYADLVRLHPAVTRVLPVAVRRWRKHVFARETREELAAFRRSMRPHTYDRVIDAQGLLKSAALATMAVGERHGFNARSAREGLAALTYHRRHAVPWSLDAVARNRKLVGDALGYAPRGEPDYGIAASPAQFDWLPAARYCVCLTGTTDAAKLWPEERWGALGNLLGAAGMTCVLPHGTQSELMRATRVRDAVDGALLPAARALSEMAGLLAGAALVIGVDTGLTHLGAALGRPTIGIFCGTSPRATGVIARCARNVGDVARTPAPAAVWSAAGEICELTTPVA